MYSLPGCRLFYSRMTQMLRDAARRVRSSLMSEREARAHGAQGRGFRHFAAAYFGEWHGVDKAWGDDFSAFESRISALELQVSSWQALLSLEPKSSSLATFAKYLTFLWWIKEETMAERRVRHQER